MSTLWLVVSISLSIPAQPASENPLRNGSFEALAPNGFPEGWAPLGKVEVSAGAHSGERSLRLVRTTEPARIETGINSQPMERLAGGLEFFYKAISARDAALRIYAIPIGITGIENTGSPRAAFSVPEAHVGDGRWHRTRLKYDFRPNPAVRSVIVASRIEGTSGELLLDDVSYLERTGPVLRFGKVRLEEDPDRPGSRCTLCAPIENAGDEPARGVRVAIEAPAGLEARPRELDIGDLAPDARKPAKCILEGERLRPGAIRFRATPISAPGSPETAEEISTSLELAPRLELKSFGPVSPVAAARESLAIECVLANPGTVAILGPRAEFSLGSETAVVSAERILPGRSVTLAATFRPLEESPTVPISVRASAPGFEGPLSASSSVIVGASAEGPEASRAVLENDRIRLAFRKNAFGFGPASIEIRAGSAWRTVTWLPRLSRIAYLDESGARREQTVYALEEPRSEREPGGKASLRFEWTSSGPRDRAHRVRIAFELSPGENAIAARYELEAGALCRLLLFEGPILYALERDEAIYPGLEWLVGDEVSSSALDIAETHPDRIRYVVHPNFVTIPAIGIHSARGTVGLLWDLRQRWDGRRDRPSVVFASPDRFENQRAHLAGLFLPSVPEFVERNAREARESTPYRLERGQKIAIEARIFADAAAADALAAIDAWARIYGIPKPSPPPRGSYEREIEFSMQAYLRSLWVSETKEWWTTKGGGSMSAKGRPREFVADLLLGAALSPDPEVRSQCRARAEEVLNLIGGEPRIEAQRYPGRIDFALGHPARIAGVLAQRDSQGAWRFDADQVGTGPFVGADYHELGPHDAVEVGTCAAKATAILRYARTSGDERAYRDMLPTLELMESFRVPRAAQVWEVPVHTPDILAAAEAAEAFLEAYRFSGEARWLRDAVAWARRGLPFVYLWSDPERPFLLGASIPVFGASWMQGSWFGRPVQWNGLRYAQALFALAEHDSSYPWRDIATLITHSAMHQQDAAGENVALWPDNIGAVDSDKCPWVFAPRMIIANVLELLGRGEGISTAVLARGGERLHVNATGKILDPSWDGTSCAFRLRHPPGEGGFAVIFRMARPAAVYLDGERLGERADIEGSSAPCFRYEPSLAALSIRVPREGEATVRIEEKSP